MKNLTLLTDPAVLKQIGHTRVAKLLDQFSREFQAIGVPLPTPPDDNAYPPFPSNDHYFAAVAEILADGHKVPLGLGNALTLIENAVAPENRERLDKTVQRLFPCLSFHGVCDCALELWFSAPNELAQFPLAPDQNSEIENQNSYNDPVPDQPSPVAPPAPFNQDSEIGNQNSEAPAEAFDQQSQIQIQKSEASLALPRMQEIKPWPEPVNGKVLLDDLKAMISLFVVLPKWAVETLALWILHTYAFKLRDISTYIGLESPEHRCGKTTLVTVLTKLASRCLTSNNISAPAFFRAIQEYQPTLIIDEADTFLPGNEELRGILNAGYRRDTAYVVRIAQVTPTPNDQTPNPPSAMGLVSFSCWCPKLISRIGRLPTTLADRCIIIRMDRKTPNEVCERLRKT